MSEIIYDFRAIGGTLRRRRLDDWWQPAKPEPERQAAEPGLDGRTTDTGVLAAVLRVLGGQ
jgi:hypothetical protein